MAAAKAKCDNSVVLECCIEGIESVIQASEGGAHRIELCANLAQGGVTPSIGDIEVAVSAVEGSHTKVHVLIRPRPGDFVYSALEKQVMSKDVEAAIEAGAHGIAIGALLEDGRIDTETIVRLLRAAKTTRAPALCSVTFHRAFDCCTTEPLAAVETLISLGVDRVLTSGRAENAWDGREMLARLVEAGKGRIIIMPCAGITGQNVKQLVLATGAGEVHVGSGCHEVVARPFHDRNSVSLGPSEGGSTVGFKRASCRRVSEILQQLS